MLFILTSDSIFLSAQHVLPVFAIWTVQKLENLNGLERTQGEANMKFAEATAAKEAAADNLAAAEQAYYLPHTAFALYACTVHNIGCVG